MISKFRGSRRWMKNLNLVVLLFVGLYSVFPSLEAQSQQTGRSIFEANCSSCHTLGGGNSYGPDLAGVTERQSQQWLISFISNPKQVIGSGDPTANNLVKKYNNLVMPGLGLSQEQINAVISFLGEQSNVTVVATSISTPPIAQMTGNPEHGRDIFIQRVTLVNGGPACVGCHSIDDVGILGGGTLGPNLTQASIKYGEGLASTLMNITFPTMAVAFADHPLTAGEQSDLAAFIKSAAGQPQTNRESLVIGMSLAGFLVVLIFIGYIWRNRLRSVRRQLVEWSKGRK